MNLHIVWNVNILLNIDQFIISNFWICTFFFIIYRIIKVKLKHTDPALYSVYFLLYFTKVC